MSKVSFHKVTLGTLIFIELCADFEENANENGEADARIRPDEERQR